jgi:hypothetical protein
MSNASRWPRAACAAALMLVARQEGKVSKESRLVMDSSGGAVQEHHVQIDRSHDVQIEKSWPGKWLRRWHFVVRYYRARTRWGTLRRLEPILKRHFTGRDPSCRNGWISHVTVKLRALPGLEDRALRIPWPGDKSLLCLRILPWREQGCEANWNSPVTVLVFKRGKDGGKPVAVRYMALFVEDDVIHVAQLQGMRKIEMPPGLKDWTERMLRACMEFAQEENYRGVSVALAQSQYSFHHPFVPPWLDADEGLREADRIRERMQTHLNGSARDLGWPLEGEWFRWNNPNYREAPRRARDRERWPAQRFR